MPSREDRKQRITRERQEQIMEAALNVFSRRGYAGATMPEIAREAGVAVGTIYNYYRNKRDLLVGITNKYVIEPFTRIVRQTPAAAGDLAFITAVIENRLQFGIEGAARFIPLLMEAQRDPELRRAYEEHVFRPVMGMMEQFAAAKVRDGTFRDIAPALIPRIIGGMVIGFLLLYYLEGEASPVNRIDRQQLAATLAGFVLNGLEQAPEKES